MMTFFKYNGIYLIKKIGLNILYSLGTTRIFMSKIHKSSGNREPSRFVQFRIKKSQLKI